MAKPNRTARDGRAPLRPRSTPPSPDAAGLAARGAAVALVRAGLERRGGFDEALSSGALAGLDPRDRGFARALAAITFRRLGPIDRALGARLQRPPPEAVVDLLRLGLAQLLFMETPAHAAVSSTVSQAEADAKTRPFKGLVNAVLRGVLRDIDAARAAAAAGGLDGVLDLSAEAHAPPWLYARWRAAYGEATAQAIAARIADEPPTDLSLREADDAEDLALALEGQMLAGGSLRTARRGDLAEWPGFAEGRWWVQDAAAAIPARLLRVQPGESALDLCAAPGGKTLQLAAAGARVVAVDRSAGRLKRLAENLARVGLQAEVAAHDAVNWPDTRWFDAVLVDAPCTATGTFRRHPDVLWASRPGDLAGLTALQSRLLDASAARVRPGGRLVFCVCSLEPEEGEAQAAGFLRRHPEFRLDPISPAEGGAPGGSVTAEGMLRIHPGVPDPPGGADGFFAARFVSGEG